MQDFWLGIDTGGTFTDFVLWRAGALRIHKVLSTPDAPERAILQGIAELGLGQELGLRVVHGSTVATNAVLEGKGVRTLFITNRGLADMLAIGRQARPALYDLQPAAPSPPVPADHCLEIGGRLGADGSVVEALTDTELNALRERVQALAPQAVAINLLFAYLDDRFERAVAAALPTDTLFVCRSGEVLPEYREYERGIATWLNAWVGPLMQRYLEGLQRSLGSVPVAVMQSAGQTIAAEQAGRQAVRLLLSGPAGGLAGARHVAACAGRERVLTFDMGGTSTDVALIDGALQLTTEGRIGPYPVAVPMVDIHTIGAGGGSIAFVDAGGLLQVGPASAGADPGPACYGRGGRAATVTDANLVLGRLPPDARLGGSLQLDAARAHAAVAQLAGPLGLSVAETAAGIVRVADEHMARALRVMSVQRGVDPRGLTLISFGGAGGLHVCALAESLGMHEALVPVHAGVLSALGMLVAPPGRQLSRTFNRPFDALDVRELEAQFEALLRRGRAELAREGLAAGELEVERSVDLRYQGQAYQLTVPWSYPSECRERFHALHAHRYGHRLELPVELVNLRLALRSPARSIALAELGPRHGAPVGAVRLHGVTGAVPVYERQTLGLGQSLQGPALITETVATTYIAPGWRAEPDRCGNLLLTREHQA